MCWNMLQGLVCLGCEVDQDSFHLFEILLAGILEFAEDRESICEDDHVRLGSGWAVYDLKCGLFVCLLVCFLFCFEFVCVFFLFFFVVVFVFFFGGGGFVWLGFFLEGGGGVGLSVFAFRASVSALKLVEFFFMWL